MSRRRPPAPLFPYTSSSDLDSISWGSPTEPLPMIRDPRAVFDQLFGVGATPEARARRRRRDKSLLDWVMASADELKDRKSTRLNSSHRCISYAVFCLKKKRD